MKKSVFTLACASMFCIPTLLADTIGGVYLGAEVQFAETNGGFGQPGYVRFSYGADEDDLDGGLENLAKFFLNSPAKAVKIART